MRDIKQSEEIFVSYGNKSNFELFLHYGFALENNNEDDGCVLIFELEENDP